jgi:hypothetical protein
MKRAIVAPHHAAWWGGLGEERQVALPPSWITFP